MVLHDQTPTFEIEDIVKKVLLLGASGLIAPYLLPGLEPYYDVRLADVKPHPEGKPVTTVDIASYEQVLEAARGMDAIINSTVVRNDPVQSFHVNTRGAWHVMKAAAEHGIKKVIHTGPQLVIQDYGHEFDIVDVPPTAGTGYYTLTKLLSMEICQIYARTYGIQTICFVFAGLGPKPTEKVTGEDFPPFAIVWEDLQHACRLALEIDSVPDDFQSFNMLSYLSHGKYRMDKARRILGFELQGDWEAYYKRTP